MVKPVSYSVKNPPLSLDEAHHRREQLVMEVKDIEVQLVSPEPREKYFAWRHSALRAKQMKEREMMFLKGWIRDSTRQRLAADQQVKEEREAERQKGLDTLRDVDPLKLAHETLKSFARRIEPTQQEQQAIDFLTSYLRGEVRT